MDVCVAEQEPFFITIDETEAHDASVEKLTWHLLTLSDPQSALAATPAHLTEVFAVDWGLPFPCGFALVTVAVFEIVVPALAVTFT
jgi:hypothetical protein